MPDPKMTTYYQCGGYMTDAHWTKAKTRLIQLVTTDDEGHSEAKVLSLCPQCLADVRKKLEPRHPTEGA